MSITTEDSRSPINFLYPLVKRTRTEAVTAQLTDLSRLPRSQVLRRMKETDPSKWPARETLIAVIRAYTRVGDEEDARQVLEVFLHRLRPAIKARVKAWGTVVESDREDAEGQIAVKLMEYVFNTAPGEEFWECNFAGCFNTRTVNILKAFALQRTPAISSSVANASGEEHDLLAELPDAGAEIRFQDIEADELWVFLSRGNPQIGEFLYLCCAEMSDSEIARRLGVTDRTLRNWKTRIRADLGQYKKE
jgi:hypothetical protein